MDIYRFLGDTIISCILSLTLLLTGSSDISVPQKQNSTPNLTSTTSPIKQESIPKTEKKVITNIKPKTPTLKSTTSLAQKTNQPIKIPKPTSIPLLILHAPIYLPISTSSIPQTPNVATTTPSRQLIPAPIQTILNNLTPNTGYIPLPIYQAEISERIQKSVVNIYCTSKEGNLVKIITGSGVVIDPTGIVLTNAHVGEYPMLQNSLPNLNCTARTGSPTSNANNYGIEVLYVSPRWVELNSNSLLNANPQETGEFDFALLKLKTDVPKKNFTYIPPIDLAISPQVGQKVLISSYPAYVLQNNSTASLRNALEQNTIRDSFSFSGRQTDLLETEVSTIAHPGASGGAVTDLQGHLLGIIATVVPSNQSNTQKYIHAITIGHINEALIQNKNMSLKTILTHGGTTLSNAFNTSDLSRLTSLLIRRSKLGQ